MCLLSPALLCHFCISTCLSVHPDWAELPLWSHQNSHTPTFHSWFIHSRCFTNPRLLFATQSPPLVPHVLSPAGSLSALQPGIHPSSWLRLSLKQTFVFWGSIQWSTSNETLTLNSSFLSLATRSSTCRFDNIPAGLVSLHCSLYNASVPLSQNIFSPAKLILLNPPLNSPFHWSAHP